MHGKNNSHQEFQANFIWTSLAIAIFGGFTLGTHIIIPIGFQLKMPQALPVWIEVHGHLQLIGWTGMFIMAVSLYFVPRFAGFPIPHPKLVPWILRLTAAGLISQSIFQFFVPYLKPPSLSAAAQKLAQIGAFVEWSGVLIYVVLLAKILRNRPANKGSIGSHVRQMQPYFLMMMTGLFLYETLQVISMLISDEGVRSMWSQWAIKIYLAFALFPVAFALSIRTFPLFLGLTPVKNSINYWGYAYLASTIVMLIAVCPAVWNVHPKPATLVSDVAGVARDAVVLGLVWQLRIFARAGQSQVCKTARSRYDVYDKFGRFDLLLYSAYLWLVISLLADLVLKGHKLLGLSAPYGDDPAQHAFLLGFITLLIFGMAQNMFPGFFHKRRLAHPKLVIWTFIFGNAAAVTRIMPLLTPVQWLDRWDIATKALMAGFGMSGFLGIAAVALFALNLRHTWRMPAE